MRLKGALSWRGDPPLWEGLFGLWLDIFATGSLFEALPADVWRVVTDRPRTIAALAAQVTWLAIRNAEPASQYFVRDTPYGLVEFRSWVRCDDETAGDVDDPRISVGLLHDGNNTVVRMSWSGLGEDGVATTSPPAGLAQAMNFPSP